MCSIFDFLNIYSVVLSATTFILFLWHYNRSAHSYWSRLKVKYVEPVPFLGNTAKALFQLAPIQEVHQRLYRALHDEPFGGIYELFQPQLFVKDPQLVSAILIKDNKHFYDRGLELLLNKNKKIDPLAAHLFFTDGERWRVLRQKLSPVFSFGKLKLMHSQMMDCIAQLIVYLDEGMDGSDSSDVQSKEVFDNLTLNVIGCCGFGIDCNAFESNEEFRRMCRGVANFRILLVLRMLLATFSRSLADKWKVTFLSKEANDFFLNLALDTIKYRRQSGVTRNDLLQLLLELQNSHVDPEFAVGNTGKVLEGEEFNELDVAANVFLFLISGFETTASTICFCLYELALNSDIQEKLRSEVQKVRGESQNLTYEMLKEMTYMDAVINETLRKYPPFPFLTRKCTEDYVIPGTRTTIVAGTDLTIPVWSIHHDWKNYQNPEVFDPERFIGDDINDRPSGVFLPFGDGPRFCVGKRFADMEIKSCLSEMILRYDIKPCAKTEIPLKFKNGIQLIQTTCGTWINLAKRKHNSLSF